MTLDQPPGTFQKRADLVIALWPLILLTPLIRFPAPSVLVGHPWKPELFLSLFLIAVIAVLFFRKRRVYSFDPIGPVTIAMAAFVVWSGVSFLWAGSANSVVHHTLLWAEYLILFVILSSNFVDRRTFTYSIYVLGAVAVIISANCIIEYLLRESIDSEFGFRYGRFAEVWAALIPLFTAIAMRSRGYRMALSLLVTSMMWLTVLFSTSRTSLAAATLGLAIFFVTFLLTKKGRTQFKKLALIAGLLVILATLTQLTIFTSQSEEKPTVFGRIAISTEVDASNSLSRNIRFLFTAVSVEMLRQYPLHGIGADNYGVEFNKYRAAISANPANAELVTGNENAIPERAHNEYLQIAAELGIVGAIIFAAFLIALFRLGVRVLRESANIYKLAAVAGMIAFLCSSVFSSFSFRLAQNGVVFFFLAALLIGRRQTVKPQKNNAFLLIALIVCVAMVAFSSLKAASQYLTYRGEAGSNRATSLDDLSTAEKLDRANAAANYIAASKLLSSSEYGAAAVHFQAAIDKGVGTTATYSYLISAHSLSDNERAALDVAADGVRVFPYSPFLLTRYSVLLDQAGMTQEAQVNFARAKKIDARQSETWKILITDGSRKAAEAGRNGIGIRMLANLYPQDGLYAMLTERHILFPEERYTFPAP